MTAAGKPGRDQDPALQTPSQGVGASVRDRDAAPEVPAEAREELLALKSGAMFVCARRDGDIRPGRAGEGLYAACPVAVAASRLEPGPIHEIGVAYDASAAAELALTAATDLARQFGAKVRVIMVGGAHDELGALADAAAARAGEQVPSSTHRLNGRASALLIEAAQTLDLLVCGSRGRGRVLADTLGSVSRQLIEHASCPVIVVPPQIRPRDGRPLGLSTAGG